MIQGRQVPSKDTFARYGINVDQVDDISWQPLYDYNVYAAAGQASLNFFQQQSGAGTTSHPGSSGVKTVADTNMTIAGMLPSPQKFLVVAIGIDMIPGSVPGAGAVANTTGGRNWTDVNAVARSGSLIFTVGQKQVLLEAPLGKFPCQHGLTGSAAMSDQTTAAATLFSQVDYARFGGNVYSIVPVAIPSAQNFQVTLTWPNVVALPSTVAGRIGVNLFGYLLKKAQ